MLKLNISYGKLFVFKKAENLYRVLVNSFRRLFIISSFKKAHSIEDDGKA